MLLAAALVAALCACGAVYLNDRLTRLRKALCDAGLLGQDFDYADAQGAFSAAEADRRLARYSLMRTAANGMGLLCFVGSALLLYRGLYVDQAIAASFWSAWGASTGAAALFFWAGR